SEHAEAPLILEAMARGLARVNRFKAAEKALETWRKLEPDSAPLEFIQGDLHDARERTPDAIHSYRLSLELDPERDETRDRLTEMLVRIGLGEEAMPLLRPLCRRRPDSPELQDRLVRCLLLLRRTEEAR